MPVDHIKEYQSLESSYSDWSVALVKYFFGPENNNKQVRLATTKEILDQNFSNLGGYTGFLKALRKGPNWDIPYYYDNNLHDIGLAINKQWENRSYRNNYPRELIEYNHAPPFLPYLCLLALAWTHEEHDELHDSAYFNRLDLLYPNHGIKLKLKDWDKLWDNLHKWTHFMNCAWGAFKVDRVGQMAYVGIPRAQIIFTPKKLDNLHELFKFLNLSSTVQVSHEYLRNLILAQEAASTRLLQKFLFDEIKNNTPLGQTAIDFISDYLSAWDENIQPTTNSINLSKNNTRDISKIELNIVLEANVENNLELHIGCNGLKGLDLSEFNIRDFKFKNIQSDFYLAVNNQSVTIDAAEILKNKKEFIVKTVSQYKHLNGIRLELKHKKIRFFDLAWITPTHIIETSTYKLDREQLVLVSPEGANDWDQLYKKESFRLKAELYPSILPSGYRLYIVESFKKIPEDILSKYFSRSGYKSDKTKYIWLKEGTRIENSTARRVYTDYDPPILGALTGKNVTIECSGAKLCRISTTNEPVIKIGLQVVYYSFELDPNYSVITITSKIESEILSSIDFGVVKELSFNRSIEIKSYIDKYGLISSNYGILGTKLNHTLKSYDFKQISNLTYHDYKHIEFNKSFYLLESLTQKNKFIYQEFSRRCFSIANANYYTFNREILSLSALGHIELVKDQRGKISHIIPIPRQIYLLPFKNNDLYLGVITGCGLVNDLKNILTNASELEFKVNYTEQKAQILPHRIIIAHSDLIAFELLCEQNNLHFDKIPACAIILNWSCDLNDWLTSSDLRWYPHQIPKHDEEYNPRFYRNTEVHSTNAPDKLFYINDRYIPNYSYQILIKQPDINSRETTEKYAFVRDSSWAKWKTHLAIAEGDNTMIPYSESNNSIIVPKNLNFPYLINRALCMCSGLSPSIVKNSKYYISNSFGILPNEDSVSYISECFEYTNIPLDIANLAATKVNGLIKVFQT